ncbi:hypothetical protein AGMMS49992_27160 [Clostridia bacterium]|nr:hypothetical protein AGMMS49992_27160 [Clostridia bacterium]
MYILFHTNSSWQLLLIFFSVPYAVKLTILHSANRYDIVATMNDAELKTKVHSSMYLNCKAKGFVAPVDVLLDSGIVTKKLLEDWRFGRITYLESACAANLKKLSTMMHEMRVYAQNNCLKESVTFYKRWGVKGKTIP